MRRRRMASSFRDSFDGGIIQASKWTVTDTESKITVSGGNLVFAGGKATPAWANPAMVSKRNWARTAGLTIEWQVTPATQGSLKRFGFNGGSFVSPEIHAIYLHSTQIGTESNAATVLSPYAYTGLASYWCRIVCLAAGALYYVSDDNKLTWKLIWSNSSVTTSPLYAFIESYNAALTSALVRVFRTMVKPAVLQDAFTRANGNLGAADVGGVWVDADVTWAIAANKAVDTPALGSELASGTLAIGTWYEITVTQADYFYTACATGDVFRAAAATTLDANNKVKAFLADYEMQATLNLAAAGANGIADAAWTVAAGKQAGLCLRSDTLSSFLIAYVNRVDGKAYLDKCDSGTYTNLLSGTVTYAADRVLRVIVNGTVARLYYNGVEVGAGATVPSSTDTTHGLFSTSSSNGCSSFKWQN